MSLALCVCMVNRHIDSGSTVTLTRTNHLLKMNKWMNAYSIKVSKLKINIDILLYLTVVFFKGSPRSSTCSSASFRLALAYQSTHCELWTVSKSIIQSQNKAVLRAACWLVRLFWVNYLILSGMCWRKQPWGWESVWFSTLYDVEYICNICQFLELKLVAAPK